MREKVKRVEIGEEVDSDHHLMELVLKGGRRREGKRERKGKEERGVWYERG